eukprot:COSAG02_NODE_49601_length_325_cov_80.110619_1_plen_33_part_10
MHSLDRIAWVRTEISLVEIHTSLSLLQSRSDQG